MPGPGTRQPPQHPNQHTRPAHSPSTALPGDSSRPIRSGVSPTAHSDSSRPVWSGVSPTAHSDSSRP
eukprot:6620923-Pyramimonas_sp.AAC.1